MEARNEGEAGSGRTEAEVVAEAHRLTTVGGGGLRRIRDWALLVPGDGTGAGTDEGGGVQGDEAQGEQVRALTPTVEITLGTNGRATGWGWACTCGDERKPRVVKKSIVLAEAREHFDTKHGGLH